MSEATLYLVTIGIAVAALFLSALSLYLQRRDKRGRLIISPSITVFGLPIPRGDAGIPSVDVPTLLVHFANPGESAVNVRKVELSGKAIGTVELAEHHAMYTELSKPFTVNPKDGHDLHVRGQTLLNKLRETSAPSSFKARVHAIDELNRVHKSKTFEIDRKRLREADHSSA